MTGQQVAHRLSVPIIVTVPFCFEENKREIEDRVPYLCIHNVKNTLWRRSGAASPEK